MELGCSSSVLEQGLNSFPPYYFNLAHGDYYYQIEKLTSPTDGHDISRQVNVSARGRDGMVSISLAGFSLPSDERILDTTRLLSKEFPFNLDMSTGNTIGIGWSPLSTLNGTRASGWTSYIKPFLNRPNFDVLINTQVTKVIQTGIEHGKSVFQGVQFAQSSTCL
jgi:hypothetical protein